ncbi:MAG: M48 family metalloprotease [Spirulina sp. SIO3F2]|nr:M48 family metalloprotease [Spirulina sp. SIO3F2]
MKLSRSVLMFPLLWAAALGLEGAPAIAIEAEVVETEMESRSVESVYSKTPQMGAIVLTESQSAASLLTDRTIAQTPAAESTETTDPTSAPETTPTPIPTKAPDYPQSTQVSADPLSLSLEEQAIQELLAEGDRHWLADEILAATSLYQEAKPPFEQETNYTPPPPALYDPAALSPAGAVYWRYFEEGRRDNMLSKISGPIELLFEEQPQFIPAYIGYGEHLQNQERYEAAAEVLARGAALYPEEPELVRATLAAYEHTEQWLEASLLARQFVLFSPDHPEAEVFKFLADEHFDRYRGKLKRRVSNNIIGGILTSIASFALTGNIFGPLSTAQTTILLLQGEERIGERISERVLAEAPMLQDETVLAYVDEIGQALAAVAGRDEFNYEFHVILNENLNAFALPGGKIFINAGAIVETKTEAELAGLLAHEISHAALSHGFQLVSRGQLTANVVGNLPLGGLATNLLVFSYSRDMERQADRLGTRILASSGYAADGVRNLMATLEAQNHPSPPAWLSTHPDTSDRVNYLETFILEHQLNRYAFEGVERHSLMRDRVAQILADFEHDLEAGQERPTQSGGLRF